ncbi:LytR C-terminal domain-containing protein [Nocardioides faecalis]|nr:LytR C-terminal domain-containing protein [Nocardioides faecalis]
MLPSPVVILTVVAVALAAVAFVLTRDPEPTERDISATTAAATPTPTQTETATAEPTQSAKPKPKPVVRSKQSVVVFNNTRITGLAKRVSTKVTEAGWKVVAADNWYGTVPATTVYYPKGKKAAARQLALDLGVARIKPSDPSSDMSSTSLTLILTGDL